MSGRRLAVVISVEQHDDPVLRRFSVPSADVPAFVDVLGDQALGGFDVEFLRDPGMQAASSRVKALFEGRDQDDCVLLYFRGVMLTGPGGGLYLAAADTVMGRPADTALDVALAASLMQRSRAGQAVVLLDGRTGGPVDAGHHFRAARSAEWQSRVVIASTARPEPPTFAGLIADGITSGTADRDRDGWIGISELYDHLRERDPSARQWVFGSGRQPWLSRIRRPGSDQMASIAQLAVAAAGPDLSRAVEARAALHRLATGEGRVAAAATAALRRTSVRLAEPVLDFGRVAPGTRQLSATVAVQGPPLAAASSVTSSADGVHARLEGDTLRISWFPTVGRLAGAVSLDGPAGSARVAVTGEVSEDFEVATGGWIPSGGGNGATPPPTGADGHPPAENRPTSLGDRPTPPPGGPTSPAHSLTSPTGGPTSPAHGLTPPVSGPAWPGEAVAAWPGEMPGPAEAWPGETTAWPGEAVGAPGWQDAARQNPFPVSGGGHPSVDPGIAGTPEAPRFDPNPPATGASTPDRDARPDAPATRQVSPGARIVPETPSAADAPFARTSPWAPISGPPATPGHRPPGGFRDDPADVPAAGATPSPPSRPLAGPPDGHAVTPTPQDPPAAPETPEDALLTAPKATVRGTFPTAGTTDHPTVLSNSPPPGTISPDLPHAGRSDTGDPGPDGALPNISYQGVSETRFGTSPWPEPESQPLAEVPGDGSTASADTTTSAPSTPSPGPADEPASAPENEPLAAAPSNSGTTANHLDPGSTESSAEVSPERDQAGPGTGPETKEPDTTTAAGGFVGSWGLTWGKSENADPAVSETDPSEADPSKAGSPEADSGRTAEDTAGTGGQTVRAVSIPAQRRPADEAGTADQERTSGGADPDVPDGQRGGVAGPWGSLPSRAEETAGSQDGPHRTGGGSPDGGWPASPTGEWPSSPAVWPSSPAGAWPSTDSWADGPTGPASTAQSGDPQHPDTGYSRGSSGTSNPVEPGYPAGSTGTSHPTGSGYPSGPQGYGGPAGTGTDPGRSSGGTGDWGAGDWGAGNGGSGYPPPPGTPPYPEEGKPGRRRLVLVAAAVVVLLLLAGGAYAGVRFTQDRGADSASPGRTGPTVNDPAPPSAEEPAPPATEPAGTQAPVASLPKPVVLEQIKLGREPEGVAVSPDNRTLYIADQDSKDVHFVDVRSKKISVVKVPNTPRFLALSADGSRLYVSLFEDDFTGNGMAVIDTVNRSLVKTIRTGPRPFEPAVAPDGQVWVPIHNGARVEIYDDESLTEAARISVPPNPHWIVFTPDGTTAFTANHESSQISVVNVADRLVRKNFKVGKSPHALAVTPDGKQLVATNYDLDTVEVYDTGDQRLIHKVRVGKEPQAVMISSDGRYAYIVNEGSDDMSVIDLSTGKVVSTVGVGDSPRVNALSPDGRRLYVTDGRGKTVTVLRTAKE
ncbi:MAG TPA: beta-propeller fold lactonase family protein [Actinoplanes sp.]|nr:beta-propeller fold lactonase family protein [Actinoplanes sp.]